MAKLITLKDAQFLEGQQRDWAYNALDCIATREIHDVLWERMRPEYRRAHDFYMAMQGPALDMTCRGIAVNPIAHKRLENTLRTECDAIQRELRKHPMITSVWDVYEKETGFCDKSTRKDMKHVWAKGEEDTVHRKCTCCGASRMKIRPFMPTSDADLKRLLYDHFKMAPIYDREGKVTASKDARERLKNNIKYAKYHDIIERINKFADLKKQTEFLAFRVSNKGRYHASFNVGVTTTHRWSSNKDPYGRGANAQNITERHRFIFEPDPGYVLVYADLKQAESNIIAHEAGDEGYIDAHRYGDTHTYVTRLMYHGGLNGEAWPNDQTLHKRFASERNPPWDDRPGHDYRFQSKAIQHGSNLGLTPFGMAIQKHMPVKVCEDGQMRYFKAFPGIRQYQNYIKDRVTQGLPITSAFGMSFQLFGRPSDSGTYKQGLALRPQSTVGHIISVGLYRIWTQLPEVQLLAQVHDAVLLQVPTGRPDLIDKVLELMSVPVPIVGMDGKLRTTIIETEAAVGGNWGHHSKSNVDGLQEYHHAPDTVE